MEIRGLNITAYGKIENKNIQIKDGMTVFFGSNESGKSTIKNFILDMFFGGTIPGSKIARYTPKHDGYKPWSSNKYEGSMLINYRGTDYHMYRNFSRGSESLSIRDVTTGLDSKELFNVDTSRKVEVLDEQFFGITESNLRNTFVIDNSEDKDSSIGPDLRDRMINMVSTNREDLSIRDILKNIDDKYLGNDHTKEKRVLKNQIENIETELKYLPDSYQYNETIKTIDELNKQIQDLKIQVEDQRTATLDRVIIENPQYLESLVYQQERLSAKGDNLELEKSKSSRDLDRLLKIRPIILSLVIVVIVIGLYFKVYYFMLSVLIIGIVETYRGTLKNRIHDLDEEIRKVYSSLDNILEKANKYQEDSLEEENPEITALKNQIEQIQYERQRLLERARIYDINIQKEIELKENLADLKERQSQLLFIEDMANTAKSIIETMSKDNFDTVSDRLIRIASENLNYITDGKYTSLLISDTGVITLYDSSINNYVDVEDLSRGTMEQVYLSYKIAVIENLGIDFPILMDDSFAFYDEERRDKTLMLLSQIANKRQIFYFTSSDRDLEFLSTNTNSDIIYLGE